MQHSKKLKTKSSHPAVSKTDLKADEIYCITDFATSGNIKNYKDNRTRDKSCAKAHVSSVWIEKAITFYIVLSFKLWTSLPSVFICPISQNVLYYLNLKFDTHLIFSLLNVKIWISFSTFSILSRIIFIFLF